MDRWLRPPPAARDFQVGRLGFSKNMGDIHIEIKDLNQEAAALAKRIQ
jgi:hypothetical protein